MNKEKIESMKQNVKEICEKYNIPHNLDYEKDV